MDALHTPEIKRFYKAIIDLKTEEDCACFFEDICTIKELQDIAQRLEVAFMLHQGKNYQEICALTGASTATISRVKKCLVYGSGGYRKAVADVEKEENSNENQ
ncbi:MAG: DNA-binding transcriptional regulator [Ruminococcaceae bacterium]|nr:DNA-binding transcriptional regulator [Oscillospiraceae bacterium]